jgi:hypothetical protein
MNTPLLRKVASTLYTKATEALCVLHTADDSLFEISSGQANPEDISTIARDTRAEINRLLLTLRDLREWLDALKQEAL